MWSWQITPGSLGLGPWVCDTISSTVQLHFSVLRVYLRFAFHYCLNQFVCTVLKCCYTFSPLILQVPYLFSSQFSVQTLKILIFDWYHYLSWKMFQSLKTLWDWSDLSLRTSGWILQCYTVGFWACSVCWTASSSRVSSVLVFLFCQDFAFSINL